MSTSLRLYNEYSEYVKLWMSLIIRFNKEYLNESWYQ